MARNDHTDTIRTTEQEYITFYIGDMLMGIDIQRVQEINHNLDCTPVPHTDDFIRGVINLRGEVVTVLELRKILNLPEPAAKQQHRNIIVNADGESIGLVIDRISDVVIADNQEIEPAPANLNGINNRFFNGVYKKEKELLLLLNIDEIVMNEIGETVDI